MIHFALLHKQSNVDSTVSSQLNLFIIFKQIDIQMKALTRSSCIYTSNFHASVGVASA